MSKSKFSMAERSNSRLGKSNKSEKDKLCNRGNSRFKEISVHEHLYLSGKKQEKKK